MGNVKVDGNKLTLMQFEIVSRYEDGIPVEARLVDFQFTRYAPGCLDLVTLLFTSVDRATRDIYESQVLTSSSYISPYLSSSSLVVAHPLSLPIPTGIYSNNQQPLSVIYETKQLFIFGFVKMVKIGCSS